MLIIDNPDIQYHGFSNG
jgi:hypothetical protein